mgnify:CR=1 FL=1|nr:MAG TPA: hypothetical protein [Caudoviricetes sp.]
MIKPYRLKHIPTGVYYQPHKHRGSNVSLNGKVYLNGTHGLSSAWTYSKRYPNNTNSQLFSVFVEKGSRIHKFLEDKFTWSECRYSYGQLKTETNVSDWEIEYINS